jgi:hypothetical protein
VKEAALMTNLQTNGNFRNKSSAGKARKANRTGKIRDELKSPSSAKWGKMQAGDEQTQG